MSENAPYARRLVGRVAVVTGGASGIGRAMCERFASEGATVAVVDLDEEAGGAVAAEVGGMFVRADVTSSDEVEVLYGEVAARQGHIDVCCNNAGISPPDDDSILETGLEAQERVQGLSLTSVGDRGRGGVPGLRRRLVRHASPFLVDGRNSGAYLTPLSGRGNPDRGSCCRA